MASRGRPILLVTTILVGFRILSFGGIMKVNGVILQYTVSSYNTTKTMVAWAFTLQSSVSYILTPLGGTLLQCYSYRQLGVVGGILTGLGYICSGTLATQVWHLFLFHALSGIGFGLFCLPTQLYLHAHMTEKTYCIIVSSTSVLTYAGVSTFPVLITWMIENYGHESALVLLGTILLNNVLVGLAMRPTKESTKEIFIATKSNVNVSKTDSVERFMVIFSIIRHKNFLILLLFATSAMFVYSSWALFLVSFGRDLLFTTQQSVYLSAAGGCGGAVGSLIPLILFQIEKMDVFIGCFFPSLLNGAVLTASVYITRFEYVCALMVASGFAQGFLYASICGFLPFLVCKYHFRDALALAFLVEGIAYQLGGSLTGIIADVSGSTLPVFTVNGIICLSVLPLAFIWGCNKKPTTECFSDVNQATN